jgi:hypothetical protein
MNRPPDYPETPNLDKALKIQETSQGIGEFLDWLATEKHYYLSEDVKRTILANTTFVGKDFEIVESMPIRTPKERLLAEFFGIDYDEMNNEKEAVLKYVRNHNG